MSKNEAIIIVSGLPRSGTSLMMKMLEAAGLKLMVDNIREADEDNPKGYYELEAVKQMKDGDSSWVNTAAGKAVKIVAPLLQYLPDDHHYKILFMRRAMPEILASQKQMLIRRGKDPDSVPDEMMARVFEKQLDEILGKLEVNENTDFVEINFAELVEGKQDAFETIATFLGTKLNMVAMQAVVDPKLYRQRKAD